MTDKQKEARAARVDERATVNFFRSQLLDNFVAVRPSDARKTRILKPDWQQALTGVVIAIGPGKRAEKGDAIEPLECAVGDIVQFGAAAGMESVYASIPIRIMRSTDVDLVLGSTP